MVGTTAWNMRLPGDGARRRAVPRPDAIVPSLGDVTRRALPQVIEAVLVPATVLMLVTAIATTTVAIGAALAWGLRRARVAMGEPPARTGHHGPGGRETAGAFGRRGRGRQHVPLLPATRDRRVLPRGRIPGLGGHRPSPGPTVRERLRPGAPRGVRPTLSPGVPTHLRHVGCHRHRQCRRRPLAARHAVHQRLRARFHRALHRRTGGGGLRMDRVVPPHRRRPRRGSEHPGRSRAPSRATTAPARHDGVAQAKPADLAGGVGAGSAWTCTTTPRLLGPDERGGDVRTQLLDRRQRRARPHHDRRADHLAPRGDRGGRPRHLGDRRVRCGPRSPPRPAPPTRRRSGSTPSGAR